MCLDFHHGFLFVENPNAGWDPACYPHTAWSVGHSAHDCGLRRMYMAKGFLAGSRRMLNRYGCNTTFACSLPLVPSCWPLLSALASFLTPMCRWERGHLLSIGACAPSLPLDHIVGVALSVIPANRTHYSRCVALRTVPASPPVPIKFSFMIFR